MYDNAEFLTQEHIPPAKVHLTEIIVSSYEQPPTTVEPLTERIEEKNDFLAPILQMPSFRKLFEMVASFVGKTKDDIMQLFTGSTEKEEQKEAEVKLTVCQEKREEMTNSAIVTSYWMPRCDENGDFDAEQCNASVCWCVDTKTGQNVPNSMKRVGAELNCDLIDMTNLIQVEFNKPTPTVTTTPATTTTTTEPQKCVDLDLCQVVFRSGDFSACQHHADFMHLCPRSCDPSCGAEKPCEDIFQKCADFKSYCGIDAMIDSGCPVTCGKCSSQQNVQETKDCVDRYTSCSTWKSSCHSPSVLASCPATCEVCDEMISFDQIETSFIDHLESTKTEEESVLPIKIENPQSAMEHLSSFINSFTSSFEDRETTSEIIEVEEIEREESYTVDCLDMDPRCDTYTEFCQQDNIKLLCPLTCQVDGCKTTTSSTTSTTKPTTTSEPVYSGDGSGDFEVDFNGSGDELGSGQIEEEIINTHTVLVGTPGAVELIAARHQCELENRQEIRLDLGESEKTHMMYFADEYFAQSDCDFVLTVNNDDIVIVDFNIIDVRTTQNCDHYVDVYSDDTPIGKNTVLKQ